MTKILLSTGGTGGHIFPILSLYKKLNKMKEIDDIKIMTDKRAKIFLNTADIVIIKSDSPFRKAGVTHMIKTFFYIFISTLKCFFFLISYKPKIIIGLGETAFRFLFPDKDFSKERGKIQNIWGYNIFFTYHPKDMLFNERLKKPAWEDLKKNIL